MIESLRTSLDEAFDRFGDFVAIQGRCPSLEAVNRLQEAFGMDADARRVLVERLESDFDDGFEPAPVLLGLILGVSAARLAEERGGAG